MSGHDDLDVVVVGAGPGGYVAAVRAAQHGLRVAVVERDARLGGRCLREACIPAKAVLRAAAARREVAGAGAFGIEVGEPTVAYGGVVAHRDRVIDRLGDGVRHLLAGRRVRVVHGSGRLVAGGGVAVGDEVLVPSRGVILAAGSVARELPGLAFGPRVLDTGAAWLADELPGSLAVVGAGASGVELADALATLGARVHLIDQAAQVLPGEEPEAAGLVARALGEVGVDLRLGATVESTEVGEERVVLRCGGEPVEVERVVVAAGRTPDVEGLGLDVAGVQVGADGRIAVDPHQRTSAPGVYAIGDLCPGPALAHKASAEAIVAADHLAGADASPVDLDAIPRTVFCRPNVASIGMTEGAARAAGHEVSVGRVPYRASGAAVLAGVDRGFVKIVAEVGTGALLGACVAGDRAPELLQQVALVRGLEGGPEELAATVFGHPTLGELVWEASLAVSGRAIHA